MSPVRGITEALAVERARRVRELRYALHLTIPADPSAPIAGRIRVSFALDAADADLVLDFAPDARGRLVDCTANGADLPVDVVNGHLVVPADWLRPGRNTLEIAFDAGQAPLNRRDDYLYTIFVPARAHEAFPCFDQPALKAHWTLTLDVPAEWAAVSNGTEIARAAVGDPAAVDAPRTIIEFAETAPLPTYLFAFAAGRFDSRSAQRGHRALRLFHRADDAALVAQNVEAIVGAHVDALAWLEAYTAIPYPFETFDIVLLPAFQFSGMEHPGAIFYSAPALLLDPSATADQHLARASLIAHETAHIWFGDLVTMQWFNDVWIKEVFANFLASKFVAPRFPAHDHELRFLHAHYPAAYDVDRTAGTHPIRQPLDNLLDAGSLYGPIIYLKSPIVMRQLERRMGEDALRDGLRDYLRRFAFGNASWPDLLSVLQPRADFDLASWSHDWIDEPGRPIVLSQISERDGEFEALHLSTVNAERDRGPAWPQILDVALGYGVDRVDHLAVLLERTADVDHLRGHPPQPDYVLPNGRGFGYGEFRLDERSRDTLLRDLSAIEDPLTRGSAWLTLWDAMLGEHIAPAVLAETHVRAIEREANELNLQRLLTDAERLLWTFHAGQPRLRLAGALEQVLRAKLEAAPLETMKAAAFACLRSVALTDRGVSWLRGVWSGDEGVDGLRLSERDRVRLAQELAVRDDRLAGGIIEEQLSRTVHRDVRAALTFVAPALSPAPADRLAFFGALRDPANRRREPWVVEGLRWLHHPLRAEWARALIEPGLDMLVDVKRTGDIFLPKRWADAILQGHQSCAASDTVSQFLHTRPSDYPPDLRRIVLASSDLLCRACRICKGV